MTELEYILATDVRALDLALDALHTIVTENNPYIPGKAYRLIRSKLTVIRDNLRNRIEIQAEVASNDAGRRLD